MNAKVTTHLYPRAAKANKNGLQPIYIRVTLDGKRKEISTKHYINPKTWDPKNIKVKGNQESTKLINIYLHNIKNKITQTIMMLEFQNENIDIETFIQLITGNKKRKERSLIPIVQDHNNRMKALIGKEYAEGTLQRYETALSHLKEFLKYQYQIDDIPLSKLNHSFIADFDFYLRTVRNCANNTTVKYIKNVKKIINICLSNGWLDKDPFLNYKTKLQEVERDILTQTELQILIEKDIIIDRLELIRDLFLFSCFTGLAFIDVKKLTKQNIVQGIDGSQWISTHRQKTETASRIPLLDIPKSIINKYKEHPKAINEGVLLPVGSNQKTNAYLKEIAAICGIEKDLTFHCARHTFATTVTLSNGVPIESVSKMLGHKSIKTTQHYAKITDKKVADDMQQLRDKIDKKIPIEKRSAK